MYRSGLILGIAALFVAAGATLVSPVCAPCAIVFLGLGAGYLAGVYEKPSTSSAASRVAAIGGALGGLGALLGQGLGTAINGALVGPQGAQRVSQVLGMQLPTGAGFEQTYWILQVGTAACLGLLDVLLMAAFGALGGLLWWQTSGKNANPPAPPLMG